MSRLFPLLLILSLTTPCFAQSNNPEAILKELETLEVFQAQTRRAKLNELLQTFQEATRSGAPASSLYADAIMATKFAGRAGGGGEYSEWRKDNAGTLRSREVNTALQYHFRYLALLMALEISEDEQAAAAASLQYARDLAADPALAPSKQLAKEMQPFAKELMEDSLANSSIAKHLHFAQYLDKGKKLEMAPGNLQGILEKNVRPYLREAKNPALLETWSLQIQFEENQARKARVAHRAETFDTVDKPRLLFNRAKDIVVLEQKPQALNEMMQLIRGFPQHPDRAIWIAQAKKLAQEAVGGSSPSAPEPEETATDA